MKFINTGKELVRADCIESIEPVETGKRNGVSVYLIRITTIADNYYYYYNPDKVDFMSAETASALMERLVKEIQED